MSDNNTTAVDASIEGVPADADALFTYVGMTRLLLTDAEDPKSDEMLAKLYGRFQGRAELLVEAGFDMLGWSLEKCGVLIDRETTRLFINEYLESRMAE